MARSIRPPYRMRARVSLPYWSVPSRWPGVSGGGGGGGPPRPGRGLAGRRGGAQVPPEDAGHGEALAPGRVDEPGRRDGDRGRAQAADQSSRKTLCERQGGQKRVIQVPAEPGAEAAEREDMQVHAEQDQQDDPEPE